MRYLIPQRERCLDLWDGLLDGFFTDDPQANRSSFIPSIEVHSDEKNVYVKAEIAGIEKKDINVEYKDKVLTLSGEKHQEQKEEEKGYYYSEIAAGNFCRRINVGNIDFNKAQAEYKNGTLKITLPKIEAEQSKRIEIK